MDDELAAAKSDFKWKRVMPTEEQKMKMKENSKKGWILEVDLEYPKELHERHNSYNARSRGKGNK